MSKQPWWVYMLRCADDSLYTGITTDPERRLREHNQSPRAARYTRVRRPVEMVMAVPAGDRSTASRLEAHIKRLSRREKLRLLAENAGNEPGVA